MSFAYIKQALIFFHWMQF